MDFGSHYYLSQTSLRLKEFSSTISYFKLYILYQVIIVCAFSYNKSYKWSSPSNVIELEFDPLELNTFNQEISI